MKNFESAEQKKLFLGILKTFSSVLFSTLLIIGLLYLFGGFYKTKRKRVTCQAEEIRYLEKEKYFHWNGHYFSNGHLQSDDFAHSYNYSIKLTKENRFGLKYKVPAAEGDEDLWITVWRYNPEGQPKKGKLVCRSGSFYQSTDEVKESQESGWEKLFMRAFLPLAVRNQPIEIFCEQEGEGPVYFDDLNIEYKRADK